MFIDAYGICVVFSRNALAIIHNVWVCMHARTFIILSKTGDLGVRWSALFLDVLNIDSLHLWERLK